MNKAKLFLVAAAPAALVMPIDAFAAETEKVTITGIDVIGSELSADISALPTGTTIYQWVYETIEADGTKSYTDIPDADKNVYTVRADDAGKSIVLKVSIDGTEYISNNVSINAILPTTGADVVNGIRVTQINSGGGNPPVFKSYQWYYIEFNKKIPIASAKNVELAIPPEVAGKDIIVEAISEDNVRYTSMKIPIKPLKLKVTDPTFEGFTNNQNVVPGDVLKVKEVSVTDTYADTYADTDVNPSVNATLKPEQISYTYQWMHQVGDAFSYIDGATSSSYTVPADALEKEVKKIAVRVTATVGTTVSDPVYSTTVFLVNNDRVIELIGKIFKLRTTKEDKIVYDSGVIGGVDGIEGLQQEYNSLTTAAKANVTNYSILERAVADKKIIDTLKEKVERIPDIPDAQKVSYISNLKDEYEKLDYLQRSMDKDDMLYKGIFENTPGAVYEISKVRDINAKILGLLIDQRNPFLEYNNLSLEDLENKVKEIDALIAKLSPEYKSTVQYQDVLKTAKSDIKVVQTFIKKFDKLDLTAEPKKQISTAKSIRSAYNKLTIKQMGLVPSNLIDDLEKAENPEQEQTVIKDELQPKINSLITIDNEGNVKYNAPSAEKWSEYSKDVSKVITMYKSLTKEAASKVEGYQQILTLQKDLKAAEKVVKQITAYEALLNADSTKYPKLKSSYKSMLQAFNKLTTLQQSLVYNSGSIGTAPVETPNGEPDDEEAKQQAQEIINVIDGVLGRSTTTEINVYALEISNALTLYNNAKSARKYVTNYDALKTMEKDVKSVLSFIKKVDDADAEANLSKKYTKIQSVKAAYVKLSAKQQALAAESYTNLVNKVNDNNTFENLREFNEQLLLIIDENNRDLYDATTEAIKDYEKTYSKLSSAEKKQITNYPILKQAISDVKKVESFLKKYQTEKTQAAALKSFASLTAKQTSLINDELLKDIYKKLEEQQSANEGALTLIESINTLLQNGVYKDALQNDVKVIRDAYDALSVSEKSLVKNYSKLTQAESDLQKVAEVYALKEDLDAWQKAYNKLSRKLESLYDQIYKP